MAYFAYIARAQTGEERSGEMVGESVEQVVSHLHAEGLVVLRVANERSRWPGLGATLARWLPTGGVSTCNLAIFTRQLATILRSGIPLVRGLRGLAADTPNRRLARAIDDLALRIERGEGLSDGLGCHPQIFNRMYISLVHAGEQAGTLDDLLDQLAVYLERTDAIKTRVRGALVYPIFVIVFAVVAGLFLIFKIVPTFQHIYGDLGQQLPAITRIVIGISTVVRTHVLLMLPLVAGLGLLLAAGLRTRRGRYLRDSLLLRLPIFGTIVRKAVMSRCARTFGILLHSGLPILRALDLVGEASGNAVVARGVERARDRITAGQAITPSFRATGVFPEMLLQLMGTGEESGELDTMLQKTSDFYDRQVEASVQGLTSLIEPLLIVVVGGVIGVIVVSMFLPIFYMGDALMKGGYNM